MMNHDQLITIAEALAGAPQHGETRGRPQQMQLRKATSQAYYAMFYALANSNADTLIGSTPATRASEEWTTTHRALNHGPAKTQMSKTREMSRFHPDIQDFSDAFVELQVRRHDADYNPNPVEPFTRSQTMEKITRAKQAIEKFRNVLSPERRRFAAYILFGRRN